MEKSRVKVVFGSVAVLFVAFLMLVLLLGSFANTGEFGDSFGILTSLFTGLGFAGLVVTILMQQEQMKAQERERIEEVAERRSLFNLTSSIEAYGRAQQLLASHGNVRATWIEAGRLLGHAKVIGAGVTIEAHQRVLEFNRLQYRTFFSELIQDKPGGYFYGVSNYGSLEEAAKASTAPAEIDGVSHRSPTRQLAEESVHAVWEAGRWPEPFIDPLGSKFTTEEKEKLSIQAPGLLQYLMYQDQWRSAGGSLKLRVRTAQVLPSAP
jgi:hypothetical protein